MPPIKKTVRKKRTQNSKAEESQRSVLSVSKASNNEGQKKKKSSKGKSENIAPPLYRDMTIPLKVREKWKPISHSTISFVRECLESNIIDVLGCVHTEDVNDIQDLLNSLKDSLLLRMSRLKGPPNSMDTYKKLHDRLRLLEEMIDENTSHIETVNEKIEEQERIGDDLKDQIEEMEQKIQEAEARFEERDSDVSEDDLEFLPFGPEPRRADYRYLLEKMQELAPDTSRFFS